MNQKEAIRKALKRAGVNESIQVFCDKVPTDFDYKFGVYTFDYVVILGNVPDDLLGANYYCRHYAVNPDDTEMDTFNKVFNEVWGTIAGNSTISTYSPKTAKFRVYNTEGVEPVAED